MHKVIAFRKKHLIIPAFTEADFGVAGDKSLIGKPNMSRARDMGSINKAKRESRAIQLSNGGLGAGAVSVLR